MIKYGTRTSTSRDLPQPFYGAKSQLTGHMLERYKLAKAWPLSERDRSAGSRQAFCFVMRRNRLLPASVADADGIGGPVPA